MPTQAKIDAVAEIKADLENSEAIVLTEYRGLSVPQMKELRRSLGEETKYSVVKNKLTEIAAKQAGVDAFDGQLKGPTAMAFVKGDPVKVAKSLTDFAKQNPELVIKTGLFEGNFMDEQKIKELASLESREFQLSKVAGVLKAVPGQAVRIIDALRQKREEEEGAPPSALGEAAEEKITEEAPSADSTSDVPPADSDLPTEKTEEDSASETKES